MEERKYLYWLMHVPGIGAVTIFKLYAYFGSFREVWKAEERALSASKLLTEKRQQALMAWKKEMETCKREYDGLSGSGTKWVSFLDAEYPKRLEPFSDRPPALFIKGSLPRDELPSVAIIGARDCTDYGKQMAERFAAELAAEGIQIVSGLAIGIDGAAHLGAMKVGGDTYAVLGCGINICYPRENYSLFERIESQGGLITEFVPGTRPEARNFPMRNRILSGLSDAVIIIEAKEKSGSLITADLALEQGKEVFALPGRLTDPLSAGCNRLLQSGAALCLDPADILDFFDIRREKKLTLRKISEKRLAKKEDLLYSFLDSRPRHLEEIMSASDLDISECMEILLKLELMGLVHGTGNQYYCRKL